MKDSSTRRRGGVRAVHAEEKRPGPNPQIAERLGSLARGGGRGGPAAREAGPKGLGEEPAVALGAGAAQGVGVGGDGGRPAGGPGRGRQPGPEAAAASVGPRARERRWVRRRAAGGSWAGGGGQWARLQGQNLPTCPRAVALRQHPGISSL